MGQLFRQEDYLFLKIALSILLFYVRVCLQAEAVLGRWLPRVAGSNIPGVKGSHVPGEPAEDASLQAIGMAAG